jgi:hypothetical protein
LRIGFFLSGGGLPSGDSILFCADTPAQVCGPAATCT